MVQTNKIEHSQIKEIPNIFQNRVIRYFSDVDMRNGHHGLSLLSKKHGININDLAWGEFLIFVNSRRTMLKTYSQGGLVSHLKMPDCSKIDPSIIPLIPKIFGGKSFSLSRSALSLMEKDFGL